MNAETRTPCRHAGCHQRVRPIQAVIRDLRELHRVAEADEALVHKERLQRLEATLVTSESRLRQLMAELEGYCEHDCWRSVRGSQGEEGR